MAIKILDNLNLSGSQITNVLAQVLDGAPTGAAILGEGQFYYDSGSKSLNYYNGSTFVTLDGSGSIETITGTTGISAVTSGTTTTIKPVADGASNLILANPNDGKSLTLVTTNELLVNFTDGEGNSKMQTVTVGQIATAVGGGTVTDVSGTLPITSTGGATPVIAINAFTGADGTDAGLKGAVPAPAAADNVNFLRGDGSWASVPAGYSGWALKVQSEAGAGVNIASGAVVDFVGSGGITFSRTGSVVTATSSNAAGTMSSFKAGADSGTAFDISNGDTLTLKGAKGITTVVGESKGAVDIAFNATSVDDYAGAPTKEDFLVGAWGGDGEKAFTTGKVALKDIDVNLLKAPTVAFDMGTQKISNVVDPTAAQEGATKNYVDTTFAGSGALIFQGAYDATTAAPTGAAVLKGFTYAVTVAGSGDPEGFWSPVLEVGDLIIANSNNPTSAADWTEINKNIDVATATIQGIANFPSAGGLSVVAGAVSLADSGVTAATYGTAAKVAQVTVDAKGIVTGAADVDIAITASQVTSFCAEVESCVAATTREQTGTFGVDATTEVAHDFGTKNVMVQVYETATGATVMVNVERTDVKTITFKTRVAAGDGALTYMMQKIGA